MIKLFKILKNIFITKTPIYVIFFVTSFCNARCKMCFNWKEIESNGNKNELTLEEIKKIFTSFGSLQQITLSGGEPYLRNDLPEILEFLSYNNNLQMVTIPTNGLQPKKIYTETKRILQKIKKQTHLRMSLSVEGVKEKHDEIVQVPSAFEKIIQTYNKLRELKTEFNNLNIDIAICTSVFNKTHIKELLDYCYTNFPDCVVSLVLARGDTRDKSSKDVTPEEYKDIVDYFYQLGNKIRKNRPFSPLFNALSKIVNYQVLDIMKTNEMPSRCYSYTKQIVIQSDGQVFPCEYLPNSLGNLKNNDYDIKKIINNKENKKIEKSIINRECCCTWECALTNNIVCNPKTYFKVLKKLIK